MPGVRSAIGHVAVSIISCLERWEVTWAEA